MTRDEHFAHARELMIARGALRRAVGYKLDPALASAWGRGEALRALDVALAMLRADFARDFPSLANPYEVTS